MTTAEDIIATIESMRDERQAANLMRFFKTGRGEYGEGDRFFGLKVPQTRAVVKEARRDVALPEIEKLLYSQWHEVRLAGFLLLVEEMKAALPSKRRDSDARARRRDEIAEFYLRHARQANNWDLVDMSCPKILGEWLIHRSANGSMPDRAILDRLVGSDNLWEQRIGIVTTWRLIREGQTGDTLRLAPKLLSHSHDLIHKATGWMLREVGKKDMEALDDFLERYCTTMPRTALRYAIEKKDEAERQYWLRQNR
ncbi:MAG: DNA alkylation repair protein [Muribaculaceae bacterium]|nr:DNA alkylation repair protein [Muribaculaceae bacterium]